MPQRADDFQVEVELRAGYGSLRVEDHDHGVDPRELVDRGLLAVLVQRVDPWGVDELDSVTAQVERPEHLRLDVLGRCVDVVTHGEVELEVIEFDAHLDRGRWWLALCRAGID